MKSIRVALIHSEKKLNTGASYINDLISKSLSQQSVRVRHFYPRQNLLDAPLHLRGLKNILFFHSLLEKHRTILRTSDLIQGTTYTPLAFLPFSIPVVSHFGSTTHGFLEAVPRALAIDELPAKKMWYRLKKEGAIPELNVKSRKALRDVAEIEAYVASHADGVIATSQIVQQELIDMGVAPDRIQVIHNAIEDYWFDHVEKPKRGTPSIISLGRFGADAFTLKLKGIDRLFAIFDLFPSLHKIFVGMTSHDPLTSWCANRFPHLTMHLNAPKESIPQLLSQHAGSILFIPSRYEGFSLSLIEGMSRGLVPVIYDVGVAPEIIDGHNGFRVRSIHEARRVIDQLVHDEPLRLKMAARAIETAQHFSTRRMAKEIKSFYTNVLQRWHSERPQNHPRKQR